MNFSLIANLIGILLCMFSLTMFIPMFIDWYYHQGYGKTFIISFFITFISGLALWLPNRKLQKKELNHREGFLITALFWIVLSSFATIPFMLNPGTNISFSDALFESVSGLTTTGATTLVGLDALPKSLLYYRQQLQWLGGIGVIVIAVAVLPLLGVGGMQLYKAETPGPNKEEKLSPRIAQTASWILILYTALTVLCAGSYWLAGMSLFDAICHSYATVSTGGFSTYDASLSFFKSNHILVISSIFMLLGATSFTLHYYCLIQRKKLVYFKDSECTFFVLFVLLCSGIVALSLNYFNVYSIYKEPYTVFSNSLFQVVTIITSTGFTSDNFSLWPSFLPVWLMLLSCVGGCAGSTAGGMKVIRVMILFKQGTRELFKLVHPNTVVPIKLRKKPVPDSVVSAIWSFASVYFCIVIFILIALMITGLDFTTAFSTTLTAINNTGPALGEASVNFKTINDPAKWILSLAMLLGRLELFTLLVIFTPEFWRK